MTHEQCLLEIAKHVRASLSEIEELDSFILTINMSGRINGDINISIDLNHQYKYGFDVKGGNNIDAVIDEFKRRFGWQQRNTQLCLPNAPQIDEMPLEGA